MLKNKDGELFYMRLCDKCGRYFFVTAKNARICEECLDPVYKKFFAKRNIKYVSYDDRKCLKGGICK
jgi:uncharacterized OB-fold protein